jgi:hypothetical protein
VTPEQVRAQSENPDDQTPMPHGSWKFQIHTSPIEGKGIFACADIGAEEYIGPARIGGLRTPLGRYTNHGHNPNAIFEKWGERIVLKSLRPIQGNRGGQIGEEITVDYRKAREVACLE